MGKGGAQGSKVSVTQYYRSITYGLCHGVVDVLNWIDFNEKRGFAGAVTGNDDLNIRQFELFGGVRREGGVQGRVSWRAGGPAQNLNSTVASRMGGTPQTLPGYRGIAHATFYNTDNAIRPGFYFGANQPTMPNVTFNVTRLFDDWLPEYRSITVDTTELAICFTIDSSGSMDDDGKIDTVKTAMNNVFDSIESAVETFGLVAKIRVIAFSSNTSRLTQSNVDAAKIQLLRDFVDDINPSGVTNYEAAVSPVKGFFEGTLEENFDRRLHFFIVDGVASDDPDAAAADISDILDPDSGQFNKADGTEVESYSINIVEENTDISGKLDNTPEDGVPVLGALNQAGLTDLIQQAVFQHGGLDMNPAHIIYETLTNVVWGMGLPTSEIDDDSFTAAAIQLSEEGFGLSMIWTQQTSIEEFVQEVIDHIEASLYVSPQTGKFILKLIRADYDVADLPLLDESNSVTTSVSRRSPGETVNEIVVTWTSPISEKEETVSIQDLGGIVASGGSVISDSRNYYGVRRQALAWELAKRDITSTSAPIFTAKVRADRRAAEYAPGGVFRLTSEEHGIDDEVVRIAKIDRGRPGDSAVEMDVTQDVFALDRPQIEEPEEEDLQDEALDPENVEDAVFMTLNYFFTQLYVEDVTGLVAEYPDAFVGVFAATSNTDAQWYILYGPDEDAAGNTTDDELGVRTFTSRGLILEDFDREAQTTTTGFNSLTEGDAPVTGGFGLIGDGSLNEDEFELVLISDFDGTTWTLERGVLDTVPKEWPQDTPIRFFAPDTSLADQVIRADTETISYKLLMQTSSNRLDEDEADEQSYTLTDRGYRPYRPANVAVEGSPYNQVDAGSLTEVTVTWSNRNRITEDSQVLSWDDATVTPEDGQTTVIEFYNETDGTLFRTTSGLSGTSYNIPIADFDGVALVRIKVFSERDGLRSFNAHEHVILTKSGYGNAYGLDYGGSS